MISTELHLKRCIKIFNNLWEHVKLIEVRIHFEKYENLKGVKENLLPKI